MGELEQSGLVRIEQGRGTFVQEHAIDYAIGKRTRFFSVPMGLGVAGAKAVCGLTRGRVDYVEKVLRLGEDRSFPHEAASRDFGYEPEPFEVGLRREVEEYIHVRT